ncbi:S9 family peptidase [bacterium]|nr:S9 family peptidase [bacterium]
MNKNIFPFIVSCIAFATAVSAAQTPTRWTPELMITCKRVGDTAVSPDGKLIAYTISSPMTEGENSEFLTHIRVVSVDGRLSYQFTHGDVSCTDPSFSPDGNYLAFESRRGSDGKNQVWLLRLSGGDAEQLTSAETGVNSYAWSPDGTRIACTMDNPDTGDEAKAKKEKRDMKVRDKDFKFSHLYTITVEAGPDGKRKMQRLTSGDFHVTTFDWSPDGKTIVFGHQPTPSPDDWLSTDISSVPADSGAVKKLVSWKGADRFPLYSPDGKWIAFASDGGEPNWALISDVYLIPAQGGEPRRLSPTPDRSFTYYGRFIGWSADSGEIYVQEANHTYWSLFAIPANGGKTRLVSTTPGTYTGTSMSRNGAVMAFVFQTSELPPDIYVTDAKTFNPRKLTDIHAGYPKLPMGRTEVITWKARDGLEIEGLLTYPVNYVKGRRCPLILNVHGGPHSFFSQRFTGEGSTYPIQAFAQEGYAILRPNPRGSSGYGRDFRYANMNDWGFGDFEDLMAGVDKVIEMGIAHPDSLCVTGWSYGGYMTSAVVTKTKRFKAAVMGAGLPDLISFTGTSDIASFIPNYFGGEPWDQEETYIKHSPQFHVKGVMTPTLILHGEQDRRVPLSQGEEFYNALKRQSCKTEMVVYPRQPHGLQEPKFIVDAGERIIEWFNGNLGK